MAVGPAQHGSETRRRLRIGWRASLIRVDPSSDGERPAKTASAVLPILYALRHGRIAGGIGVEEAHRTLLGDESDLRMAHEEPASFAERRIERLYDELVRAAALGLLLLERPEAPQLVARRAPVQAPPPPPPPPRAPAPPVIEEPAEPITFDQSLQAETLAAASELGLPFCEECEKARAEQARTA
jgi:hypothetical protein